MRLGIVTGSSAHLTAVGLRSWVSPVTVKHFPGSPNRTATPCADGVIGAGPSSTVSTSGHSRPLHDNGDQEPDPHRMIELTGKQLGAYQIVERIDGRPGSVADRPSES